MNVRRERERMPKDKNKTEKKIYKCKPTNKTHVHTHNKPYLPINRITRNTHWTIWRQINFSQLHSPVHTGGFLFIYTLSPISWAHLDVVHILMGERTRFSHIFHSFSQYNDIFVVIVGAACLFLYGDEEWFVDEFRYFFLVSNVLKTNVTIIFVASCHEHYKKSTWKMHRTT